jgi:hypothetical protein
LRTIPLTLLYTYNITTECNQLPWKYIQKHQSK